MQMIKYIIVGVSWAVLSESEFIQGAILFGLLALIDIGTELERLNKR